MGPALYLTPLEVTMQNERHLRPRRASSSEHDISEKSPTIASAGNYCVKEKIRPRLLLLQILVVGMLVPVSLHH